MKVLGWEYTYSFEHKWSLLRLWDFLGDFFSDVFLQDVLECETPPNIFWL